ncbi:MAG TPA: phosphoenolpyruvate-utilizing N-terminal domain-containing protein, partial [Mucilaginibacter sp.]|nr:phosphoenolpyruvate-utilizing N-terminal domain-containing protein [Mucilaginibacter sp.]
MMINGIGVSSGIAIGKAHVIKKQEAAFTGIVLLNDEDVMIEIEKFDNAVAVSITEVKAMIGNYNSSQGTDGMDILEAHIELLDDPQIREDVTEKITTGRKNVNDAVIEVIRNAVAMFRSMDDEYMSARAADVQDIGNRILKNLTPSNTIANKGYEKDTIIIAEDLTPSDTISMDITKVSGFATRIGGKTSHAAIIAKSRGIPTVAGCGESLQTIGDGDMIILDGQTGTVIVNPDEDIIKQYESQREAWLKELKLLR